MTTGSAAASVPMVARMDSAVAGERLRLVTDRGDTVVVLDGHGTIVATSAHAAEPPGNWLSSRALMSVRDSTAMISS